MSLDIVLFVGACEYPDYPDAFWRITNVLSWIESKTRKYGKENSLNLVLE